MSDPYRITGVFYTERDGIIRGEAFEEKGKWRVIDSAGKNFTRSTIYLDSLKKLEAPKDEDDKRSLSSHAYSFIIKYKSIVDDYLKNDDYKKVSGSYDMGYLMALNYLREYKKIYYTHFASNSMMYILEDDWKED